MGGFHYKVAVDSIGTLFLCGYLVPHHFVTGVVISVLVRSIRRRTHQINAASTYKQHQTRNATINTSANDYNGPRSYVCTISSLSDMDARQTNIRMDRGYQTASLDENTKCPLSSSGTSRCKWHFLTLEGLITWFVSSFDMLLMVHYCQISFPSVSACKETDLGKFDQK